MSKAAAICKVIFSNFVPVAKCIFQLEQVELGQLLGVFGLRLSGGGATVAGPTSWTFRTIGTAI